jgi:hypothetical protein
MQLLARMDIADFLRKRYVPLPYKRKAPMGNLKVFTVSSFLLLLFMAGICTAADKPVPLPLHKAFIPNGFDTNDRIELMVKGTLPHTGFKLGPIRIEISPTEKSIRLTQPATEVAKTAVFAPKAGEPSLEFASVVKLPQPLSAGEYKLFDTQTGSTLGYVRVSRALERDEVDGVMLAPIREMEIQRNQDGRTALLLSAFLRKGESVSPRLLIQKNVIIVLPIMERKEGPETEPRLTHLSVELPQHLDGEYLVHVRSHFPSPPVQENNFEKNDTEKEGDLEIEVRTINRLVNFKRQ